MSVFRLTVSGYQSPASWSWRLTNTRGTEVASRPVSLDTTAWQYQALLGLPAYVQAHAVDDQEQDRLVAELGDWIGTHVFGPDFPRTLGMQRRQPKVVALEVPEDASDLLLLPLSAARFDARCLHDRLVTLVLVTAEGTAEEFAAEPDEIDGMLRVLGVFPAIDGALCLNQRGERLHLSDALARFGQQGRAVEFQAQQYDVTAKKLTGLAEYGDGWDAVHICGYADTGLLRFPGEKTAQRPYEPPDKGLAEILETSSRVKLVTISPCVSSAVIRARDLGEPVVPPQSPVPADWLTLALPTIRELTESGCAVVTFRFPIPDDFAFAYFMQLYDLVIKQQQPLSSAAALALRDLPAGVASTLLKSAPVVFGSRAIRLKLSAPVGASLVAETSQVPKHFAGRDAVMRGASGALAFGSGYSGVLLHGPPGVGKTTCARELAFTRDTLDYENRFRDPSPILFTVDQRVDLRLALKQFAEELDRVLIPETSLATALGDPRELRMCLPVITNLLRRNRYLIVLENVEVLLTPRGEWRDAAWGEVIGAVTNHEGFGRVLLTSRRLPAVLDDRVRDFPLPLLRPDEALVVAQHLDGVRALLDGTMPGIGDPTEGRRLAKRIFLAARGHPMLLVLADAALRDPAKLQAMLAAADAVWAQGGLPGTTADYVRVMEDWTAQIIATLAPDAQTFFQVVCCLIEGDRVLAVLRDVWPGLAALLIPSAAIRVNEQLVAALQATGLAAVETVSCVAVHPVLAAAGRDGLPEDQRLLIDAELVRYWLGVAETVAAPNGPDAVLAAAVYLDRLNLDSAWRVLDDAMAKNETSPLLSTVLTLGQHLLSRAYETGEAAVAAASHDQLSVVFLAAGQRPRGIAHLVAAELLGNGGGRQGACWPTPPAARAECQATLDALCDELGTVGPELRRLALAVHGEFNRVTEALRDIVGMICADRGAQEDS